jgi:hypothetical protein
MSSIFRFQPPGLPNDNDAAHSERPRTSRTALTHVARLKALSRAGNESRPGTRAGTTSHAPPKTAARTVTTDDTAEPGSWIAALLEGRKGQNRELGVAVFNKELGKLKLTQFNGKGAPYESARR